MIVYVTNHAVSLTESPIVMTSGPVFESLGMATIYIEQLIAAADCRHEEAFWESQHDGSLVYVMPWSDLESAPVGTVRAHGVIPKTTDVRPRGKSIKVEAPSRSFDVTPVPAPEHPVVRCGDRQCCTPPSVY